MSRRTELEAQLLTEPFNQELRFEYSCLLREEGEAEQALQQLELLDAEASRTQNAIARCHLSLGNKEKAQEAYRRSRKCPDFAVQEDLEELIEDAVGAEGKLSLIQGGASAAAEVVRFEPTTERVTFEDVVGMHDLKKILRLQIIEPFRRPDLFLRFRKRVGGGVLLYGPPGCGKTMIARAIATECNSTFVSVGISDVLSMWIGTSEQNLSTLFEKARVSRPAVMFFDELDALAYSRSKARSEHSRTVVNEFLAQLDGIGQDNEGVLVLAATNMPWDVDPAMKRPGRFSRQVFVPPPDREAREQMMRTKLSAVPVGSIDFKALAKATAGYSGADMDGLIDRAKDIVLDQILASGDDMTLEQQHLFRALAETVPSTVEWLQTARNLVKYAGINREYRDVEKYLKKEKLL